MSYVGYVENVKEIYKIDWDGGIRDDFRKSLFLDKVFKGGLVWFGIGERDL